jgi:hypothetical protein
MWSIVEGDEPVPFVIRSPSQEDVSVEKFWDLLTELDREQHFYCEFKRFKEDPFAKNTIFIYLRRKKNLIV